MGKQGWCQAWCQGFRSGNALEPWHKPGTWPKWLKFILILSIFLRHPALSTLVTLFFVFSEKKFECKICLIVSRLPGARNMGMEETMETGPNFNRPVKDLVYKDLLTSTFTQASHDRGIKTWRVSVSYPQCVFYGNKFRNVQCRMSHGPQHWKKQQLVRKGLL